MSRYQVYILDPKEYVLDSDKLGLGGTNVADQLLNKADDAKPAHRTGVTRAVNFQGKTVNCIELKREELEEMISYCRNDVDETRELLIRL